MGVDLANIVLHASRRFDPGPGCGCFAFTAQAQRLGVGFRLGKAAFRLGTRTREIAIGFGLRLGELDPCLAFRSRGLRISLGLSLGHPGLGFDLGAFGVLLGGDRLVARQRSLVDRVFALRREIERIDLHGRDFNAQDVGQHLGKFPLDLRDHRLALFAGDFRDVVRLDSTLRTTSLDNRMTLL